MTDFESRISEYRQLVEDKLFAEFNTSPCLQKIVYDAMKYSVGAGGKRIRPVLVYEFSRVCGGNIEAASKFACALEMIHTYSLIHDDLPCMDNDDLRRGKPSCHKAFGEANALLAGDGLLNKAFETMLSTDCNETSSQNIVKAALTVAKFSGVDGMIGGQVIDLESEGKDIGEDVVLRLYKDKTSALLRASALSGAILAGANEEQIRAADEYALNIGLAFQIVDDILDLVGDEKKLGKPIGSDKKNNKRTYVSIHGIEKSKKYINELTEKAKNAVKIFDDSSFLTELADYLCNRTY